MVDIKQWERSPKVPSLPPGQLALDISGKLVRIVGPHPDHPENVTHVVTLYGIRGEMYHDCYANCAHLEPVDEH